jgi:hypothetical protein
MLRAIGRAATSIEHAARALRRADASLSASAHAGAASEEIRVNLTIIRAEVSKLRSLLGPKPAK